MPARRTTRRLLAPLAVAIGAPAMLLWTDADPQTKVAVIAASAAMASAVFVGLRSGRRNARELRLREREMDDAMLRRLRASAARRAAVDPGGYPPIPFAAHRSAVQSASTASNPAREQPPPSSS